MIAESTVAAMLRHPRCNRSEKYPSFVYVNAWATIAGIDYRHGPNGRLEFAQVDGVDVDLADAAYLLGCVVRHIHLDILTEELVVTVVVDSKHPNYVPLLSAAEIGERVREHFALDVPVVIRKPK